ncbi:DNA gyrase subunit A [Mycoplasmopsis pullorum]|uniref:DNA gyrase subunit A n=1 Tax=Mycoplasmopsis pullorum TaxID=48003 RepID=A0A1L4FRZ1_9BACT|nr:DNA gyrase subunit A [Mycoplasmopsis pullorum]APJ38387.1 DNA gyrase subunit A [Mycoplasmopsis pullorum]AXX39143.1 DNA topoisomerase II subunit A [Mycoplasmopsis pullorum]AXX39144.1 DNA topoisomerase II subunit A [Mycoplasmopsis pullorum]AXX39145.1 DNA topoisomerase II subunit A [Mycoplasmopsis pullorum]AXX39146.1 DNA topoisomerase II subunit A [Mycoplasmopsis pullorum]
MDDKNKKDIKDDQLVHLETDQEYEYEEDNRMVFRKKDQTTNKNDDDEEEVPQDKEEYQVQPQILTEPIDGLHPIVIDNEMRTSFLEYAMSVIVSRALPDARDGLKPVHRRILFDMMELGITHSSERKKSARIVGDVLGKYHPHGDFAVYESMVRLAQDFSMRYPLVDGQGNFGSIDGDQAAAMRYTEARMSRVASEMLEGIKKNTVDFTDNYDGTQQEPVVLPSRFPNLLVSGASGIAVGLATEIPPHNLGEAIDATIALAKNPEITIRELMQHIKGPDFPTGATILGVKGIQDAYETGKGKIPVRSKCSVEEYSNGKSKIIVTEIPYAIKKTTIIEKIVELHKTKVVEGIAELRDESNRKGLRIVISVKKGYNPHILLNKLFQKSPLQQNFNANMVALVNGEPKLLNLKDALSIYLSHQEDVVTRRVQFDLEKAEDRHHILLGFRIATDNIDEVIKIIRSSKTDQEAQNKLSEKFDLSEKQTKAILDMNLRRLTGLSIEKTDEEIKELEKEIEYCKSILGSKEKLTDLIVTELNEIKDKYSDERRTEIDYHSAGFITEEDLIAENDIVITTSVKGYVKRINLNDYHTQKRGGVGSNTMKTYDDDDISSIIQSSTHTDLLLFSSFGKVYKVRAYQIPEGSKQSKGTPFINIIPTLDVANNEKIVSLLPVNEYSDDKFLTTITKKGIIKKTSISSFAKINKSGLRAFKLNEDDSLVQAFILEEEDKVLVANNNRNVILFQSSDVRPLSRTAIGVKAMNLSDDENIISASAESEGEYILSIGSKGFGKITDKSEFRVIKRGGKGVSAINSDKAGHLVFAKFVNLSDQLLIITSKGMTVRLDINEISQTSRNTKGVKIINLKEDDEITSVEVIKNVESIE